MAVDCLNSDHYQGVIQDADDCLIVVDGNDRIVICNNVAQSKLFKGNQLHSSPTTYFEMSCSFLNYNQRRIELSEFKHFVGEALDLLITLESGRTYPISVSVTELNLLGRLCYSIIIRKKTQSDAQSRDYYHRKSISEALYVDLLNDQLEVHYQPQINTQDNSLYGVELLVRWHSDQFGYVSPEEFVAIAEEFNFIDKLDFWMLQHGCCQLRHWRENQLNVPTVSVNFSPTTFFNDNLYGLVYSALKSNNLCPSDLVIEVTESKKIEEDSSVVNVLNFINKMGISISLDDFGTGYSNLRRLLKFPVSQLKLDRVFVKELSRDIAKELSEMVFQISKGMKVPLIAEGVEDKTEYELLKKMGYHIFQGYLFSRPLTGLEFEDWLSVEHQSFFD